MLKKAWDINLAQNQCFLICHWNLNSISAYNHIKLPLLRAFDVICISETYTDSNTFHEDNNLEIIGYALIKVDHLSNTKRGGTCVYHRHSLTF